MARDQLRDRLTALLGLAFVVVLVLMVWGTWLSYTKSLPWQQSVNVTLRTPSAGVGLTPPADVKLQGALVGEVREVSSSGYEAELHIELDPEQVSLIPSNVDAAIVPKTLFGEKYVDLRLAERPSADRISAGEAIAQSSTAVEISQLFSNLTDVLDSLRPEQLAVALDAVAGSLEGRGASIGETLELLHEYLTGFNPHLDTLLHDIRRTADTAEIYSANAEDLLRVLDNARGISSELLVPEERSFETFLEEAGEGSESTATVLEENGEDLVTLLREQRPLLELLAEYSPGVPCLVDGLVSLNKGINKVLGGQGPFLNVSIDLLTDHASYSYPKDDPNNPDSDAHNRNLPPGIPSWDPYCLTVPERFDELPDGSPGAAHSTRSDHVRDREGTNPVLEWPLPAPAGRQSAGAIAAQLYGDAEEDAPAVAEVLLGPMLLGGEVRVP